MYGEENTRSDPRIDDNAHLHCDFVPLTKRGIYRRKKTWIGDKENAGRKRTSYTRFALNLSFGAGESTI